MFDFDIINVIVGQAGYLITIALAAMVGAMANFIGGVIKGIMQRFWGKTIEDVGEKCGETMNGDVLESIKSRRNPYRKKAKDISKKM